MQRIFISDAEDRINICFDTGMDSRSFARAKMSQGLTESGHIVYSGGSHEIWKPSSVIEVNGIMQFRGPLFAGKRLDLLTGSHNDQQEALEAAAFWIKAKLSLGETHSALNPGAAFIGSSGDVFFAPEYLSNRCLLIEGMEHDPYNSPDLDGMDAAAFCAGAMLYTILAKTHPYSGNEIYQNMRDGVFMPVRLAVKDLDKKLSALIQSALLLSVKKTGSNASIPRSSGAEILEELLAILSGKNNIYCEFSDEENSQLKKEKDNYLLREKTILKAARYAKHNKLLLGAIAAGLLVIVFFSGSLIKSRLDRPTTAGMNSYAVVTTYFDAFNALDHILMEACIWGADRNDINTVLNLFVISKVRQAYEPMGETAYIPALTWAQQGKELPAENVFGAVDFSITRIGGSEAEGRINYRIDYLYITPDQSAARARRDILTLKQDRRQNWRITEILRSER